MKKNSFAKPPQDSIQAIIDLYKKDVDRTLIRENLKLTVEERLLNMQNFIRFASEIQKAGKRLRNSRI